VVSGESILAGQRVAVIYDCLFHYTVGGGERWYWRLAEGLRDAGADVTYLTRRQWEEPPELPGIRVIAVSGRSELYDGNGRRRLAPTICFGGGVFRWLLGHRRDYDVVEVANFPFWSVLAVRGALAGTDVRVVVDWFEIWSMRFWQSYAGKLMGTVGYGVQWACLRLSPRMTVLSEANATRLRAICRADAPVVLAGFLPSVVARTDRDDTSLRDERPYVLFAGRHIRDKGVDLLPEAFATATRLHPELRFVIAGDGPLRPSVADDCRERGLADIVDLPGWVSDEELERLITGAACVVAPSRREGYGFMPVDAMGKGTPVVTTGFEENLAVDNIDPGRNGFVVSPPTPWGIASAIAAVVAGGAELRMTTKEWYAEHAPTKTVDCSVSQMVIQHARWANTLSTEKDQSLRAVTTV
jgi:glycosyltransferase involved in cell wall biosynthesis